MRLKKECKDWNTWWDTVLFQISYILYLNVKIKLKFVAGHTKYSSIILRENPQGILATSILGSTVGFLLRIIGFLFIKWNILMLLFPQGDQSWGLTVSCSNMDPHILQRGSLEGPWVSHCTLQDHLFLSAAHQFYLRHLLFILYSCKWTETSSRHCNQYIQPVTLS